MIAVLDYGIGNLRSAEKALQHVGADAHLVTNREGALDADAVVLPGVGSFGACMAALRASGLDAVAIEAIEQDKPFLGVCVGMQLLYESSEESPGVTGLGVLPGSVRKMKAETLPQMQWNTVDLRNECELFAGLPGNPWMYFVHSYAAGISDETVGTCEYGGDTVTAVAQRGNLWATQFHPEKSSTSGLHLLRNFVKIANR